MLNTQVAQGPALCGVGRDPAQSRRKGEQNHFLLERKGAKEKE